ncbi:hypothetical protein QVD17_26879 [Tagetes erecta]|uniref:Late embryogenesis abundant protein LEA-2 subgroup domain-containing protein n=1 Tax=Tagetes erecta TaxID=13708 RepID=A0AAD8KDS4_TARER|nr:hypothetical protein QVD17_26879 [Tagetes erecta]
MPKPLELGANRRTNPLIWCLAFTCAIISTIVIVAGIIVFSGYLVIRPKVPLIYVHAARLDKVSYNQAGVLAVRLTIIMKAENHNVKAHVSYYNTKLILGYHGVSIAELVADPFDVQKNTSIELNYVVESSPIPLDPPEQYLTEQSLAKTKVMPFFLKGSSRTRWKVGPLGSVRFWLHVNCHLQLPIDSTVVYPHCTTRSH